MHLQKDTNSRQISMTVTSDVCATDNFVVISRLLCRGKKVQMEEIRMCYWRGLHLNNTNLLSTFFPACMIEGMAMNEHKRVNSKALLVFLPLSSTLK